MKKKVSALVTTSALRRPALSASYEMLRVTQLPLGRCFMYSRHLTKRTLMKRTLDAGFINTVINHPDVRPWVAQGDAALDVSEVVANPYNYCFINDGGGFIVVQLEEGVYEVHSQFLPAESKNVAGF